MKLIEITKKIQIEEKKGLDNIDIAGIHFDSRKIKNNYLFIAVKGTQTDGHTYIDKAIDNGATAVICEYFPEKIKEGISYIKVKDSASALGYIASEWFGNPSEKLILVGVTGTNGKTTIATLLYNMFTKLGHPSGLLSTVCNKVKDREIPSTHTTPDPIEINGLLSEMVSAGCEYAFMEASSHAIAQKRIHGLDFDGGIFTNLTRDHLDYHKTFENYRDAKKAFFDYLPEKAFAITNKDDKNGLYMLQNTKAGKYTYSMQSLADFQGKIIESHFEGTEMTINGKEVHTLFVGKFNAYNLLAVYGAACLLGKKPEEILVVLSTLHSVSGRFQALHSPDGYTAIVDYAHTPDALTNVLNAIHGVLVGKGEVITVVGCGGNRDKGKRPMMAREAVRLSNKVILTSDNPRFEKPEDIIKDMFDGLNEKERKNVTCITSREDAIKTACLLANTGDVILVAGKGHETYQEVKGVRHHFDDREILNRIFEEQK